MNQCLLTSVSCIILLYDQSTILTSGFGRMLKKEKKKKSLCSQKQKLTSANINEAFPVTFINSPHHNYTCALLLVNRHTEISAS